MQSSNFENQGPRLQSFCSWPCAVLESSQSEGASRSWYLQPGTRRCACDGAVQREATNTQVLENLVAETKLIGTKSIPSLTHPHCVSKRLKSKTRQPSSWRPRSPGRVAGGLETSRGVSLNPSAKGSNEIQKSSGIHMHMFCHKKTGLCPMTAPWQLNTFHHGHLLLRAEF